MSIRLECHVFKGLAEPEFCRLLETTLREHGGGIEWNAKLDGYDGACYLAHAGETHALQVAQFWHGKSFAEDFLRRFGGPYLVVRIQDGSLWDFTCRKGVVQVTNFSTLPQYWDESPKFVATYKGDPKAVGALWDVPVNRIERYMRNWGMRVIDEEEGVFETVLRGKAYPTDEHEYGDIWQVNDFVRALCGIDLGQMLKEEPKHRWINPKPKPSKP